MSVTTSTLGHVAAGYGVSWFRALACCLAPQPFRTFGGIPPNIDLHDLIEHDAVLEPTLLHG
jgi:hypothetical protein